MNVGRHNPAAAVGDAQAALLDLCRPFAPPGFIPDCQVIRPDAVGAPADTLLVHHQHMTLVLERHHGKPVDVHVLQERLEGETYTRKISLTLRGTTRVVEWGIARMNFHDLTPSIRAEILARQTPLGAILIRHRVHRRINPRYFLRFPARSRVIELFGAGYNAGAVYGRLGTIYCDGEPAVELLEIVVDTEPKDIP
jgi:hypothetical protein